MSFCTVTHANNVEVDKTTILSQNENLIKSQTKFTTLSEQLNIFLRNRSGSYTYTDSCGDEYNISWTCSGECSDSSIVQALGAWEAANTCGAGTTSNWN